MEKKVNHYIKPNVKVNDFISRHHLMGFELGDGSTSEMLTKEAVGGLDNTDFDESSPKTNVWSDME